MEAKKWAARGIIGLLLSGVLSGCLDTRPNTMPRRAVRPAPRRPTTITAPPMAQNSTLPAPTAVGASTAPVPAAVASNTAPSKSALASSNGPNESAVSTPTPTAPPLLPRPDGPRLVPPPPDEDAPPPVPGVRTHSESQSPRKVERAEVNRDPGGPPPVPSVVKAPATPPGDSPAALAQLRTLYRQSADAYAGIDSYIARLRRHEQINGKDKPEELVLFKFRKKPFSVYFKWLGIQGHNREVVYVKGKHGDQIHTLLAEGDMPLMPAGKHMSLSPDNVFVRSASRHSITEAGIGVMIDRFGKVLDALDAGDKRCGTMKYLGTLKRPEFDKPFHAAEQAIPPGYDVHLPQGGSRLWLFDPDSHLPLLLITHDHTNHEVEYYCYDRLQFPVHLNDDDFNPDRIWRR